MSIREEDFLETIQYVWELAVGMPAVPCAPRPESSHPMSRAVGLRGDWNGLLAISCSHELAHQAAVKMSGDDELDAELVSDALGEIANMMTGNVRTLLPGEPELTLPTSQAEAGATPGARPTAEATFTSGDNQFRVALYQRRTEA